MANNETDASKRIDDRIQELDDWRGQRLSEVRALIKDADPDVVEEWNVVAASKGHHAPRIEDDENVGEHLVEDGLEEAAHDQMVEARREELQQEG